METGKANNIQASTFNVDLHEQYHLSIHIGLKQLSYCIIDNTTNNVQYLKTLNAENVVDIINTEEILNLNFASISIAFANFPCTLIPNEFFQEEKAKEMLKLNTSMYDVIQSDQVHEIGAHLIYTIPSAINDVIVARFPNAKQQAEQSILIKNFSAYENKNNAYLYINNKNLNITVFKNKKLIFNNSFNFNTKEDLLYFTLFTFEQLKIDPETIKVNLYEDITKGDENYQLLFEYIRHITFGSRSKNISFSSEFNTLEEHQFYVLLN